MQITPVIAGLILLSSEAASGHFFRGNARKAKKENRNRANPRDTSSFGTSLFSKLCAENPGSNVLFSPLSVYQALALVKDGATMRSKTALELRKVLGPKTLCDEFLLLQQQSNETKDKAGDVIISMATSIWSDGLKPEYIAAAQESQNADSFPMPKIYTTVDTWIKKKTKGMIKEVMGDEAPDPLTVALLVNAVYFKGAWRYEFDPKNTIDDGTFTLIDNSTEMDAQYMTAKREHVEVIQNSQALGGADVLILDYGKADTEAEFSAMFILPAESSEDSMNDTISRLGNQPMSDLLQKTSLTEVRMRTCLCCECRIYLPLPIPPLLVIAPILLLNIRKECIANAPHIFLL